MAKKQNQTAANSAAVKQKAPAASTKKAANKPKMDLKSIAMGTLVGQIRDEVVLFLHNGEMESVDIRVKQLSYAVTEPLFTRLNRGEDVVSEWISKALVDENGENYLTEDQVRENFTQNLATAVFFAVTGLDSAMNLMGKMQSQMKTSSGAKSS